jgi:uracil permease
MGIKVKITLSKIILGMQMLFVAFGALVLVPILTGLDACVALFTAGIGTLAFQIITKFKVPVFLASSFAFIAPISEIVKKYGVNNHINGIQIAQGSIIAAGLLQLLIAFLIYKFGIKKINRFLPPIVVGLVMWNNAFIIWYDSINRNTNFN